MNGQVSEVYRSLKKWALETGCLDLDIGSASISCMTVGELFNFSLFHCAICKMGAITTSVSYDTQALRIVFSIK